MSIEKAYNQWAETYDQMQNKTRDLDKFVLKQCLAPLEFNHVLEMGCGTGKNTRTLLQKATKVIGCDFSEEMLAIAKKKVVDPRVSFTQVNLLEEWPVPEKWADLICFNLVLEHIGDLDNVFAKSANKLNEAGHLLLCELHPFKQYQGSKARFEADGEMIHLETFTHHVSEYMDAGKKAGLQLMDIKEWFDEDGAREIPRLISLLFVK